MPRIGTMRSYAMATVAFIGIGCGFPPSTESPPPPTPAPAADPGPPPFQPTACSPVASSDLAVPLHAQETSMWCWAASGQMVMDYLGTSVAQCRQAKDLFGVTNCPCAQCGLTPQLNPPCVYGGWPEFNRYGFDATRTNNAALSWATLQRELSNRPNCGNRPIAFSWAWSGEGGHIMVAVGYSSVGGTNFVSIQDPATPCEGDARILTYAAYVGALGYTHWDDFYQIRRRP